MSAQADAPISISTIDRTVQGGFRNLVFPDGLEQAFLDDYVAARARMVPLWALLGMLFFALASFSDLTMVPEMAPAIVAMRFAVFIPFAILAVWAIRAWPVPRVYDAICLGVAILGVGVPMTGMVFAGGSHLYVYQAGTVGTFLFFAIVLRPRFAALLGGLAFMCLIQFVTTRLNGGFDEVTYGGILIFYVTLAVFLAMGAYFLEHSERQNFLYRLRSRLMHDDLQFTSEHDELSGLLNRRSLVRVAEGLWRPGRPSRVVAAIMIDVDNFKLYNDVHGHVEGDSCLRSVSQTVRDVMAGRGEVFRFGGEEILVLVPDAGKAEAIALAEAIRLAVEKLALPHHGHSPEGVVTVSLGVASGFTGVISLQELLHNADMALYDAKRAGRNAVRPRLPADAAQWEERIRREISQFS